MVPNSLILLLLFIAFLPGTLAYLISWQQRRLANPYFALLAGCAGSMIFALVLAILGVRIVWLSWVQLAVAMALVPCSVMMLRKARAILRARERAINEDRMRRG